MSIYAIGDVHGCLTSLKTVFDHQTFSKDDTILFLGDYVDRGADSKGVIDWLIEQSSVFNFIFIKGNHDIMMLNARSDQRDLFRWLQFGGEETLDSYAIERGAEWMNQIPSDHWKFLENSRPYFEYSDKIFVHAGLEPGIPPHEQSDQALYWDKYIEPEMYQSGRVVVSGHTARKNGEIANFGHTICIDTYCYGGMWLSCLNVDTLEYLKANESGKVVRGRL
ncbi:MAG: serine/threonine protein phosphatase [Cyclobacteriaceae bacterium]